MQQFVVALGLFCSSICFINQPSITDCALYDTIGISLAPYSCRYHSSNKRRRADGERVPLFYQRAVWVHGLQPQAGSSFFFYLAVMYPYIFTSFNQVISVFRFVEYGESKGHLYGTSIDAIDEVLKRGRMCIIDVEPHVSFFFLNPAVASMQINVFPSFFLVCSFSCPRLAYVCLTTDMHLLDRLVCHLRKFVTIFCMLMWFHFQCIQLLRTRKLKPYVIFIKVPSPERLRQTRKNARIITNYSVNRAFTVIIPHVKVYIPTTLQQVRSWRVSNTNTF